MLPLPQSDRYLPIDILRGIALFGVLIVNLLTVFRVSLFAHIVGTDVASDPAAQVINSVISTLIEFKAFALFSFLFGVGVAIQAERVTKRGSAVAFFFRRFLVLLIIGLLHVVLIWNGDILTLYSVCGFLLIPFLRLPATVIALTGVVLIVLSQFGLLPVHLPSGEAIQLQAVEAARVYPTAGFAGLVAFRWSETRHFMLPLLLLTLPRTLGVVMLGVAAWRSEFLTTRRKLWLPVFFVCIAGAAATTVLHIDVLQILSLALAYTMAVLLWLPRAPLLAAGGQMALTNYLTQSLVFAFVFYGYGLGQFGRLGTVPVAVGGTAFYIGQLIFSRWWLRVFQFGPVEWLWRSLTYGRKQPMLRSSE